MQPHTVYAAEIYSRFASSHYVCSCCLLLSRSACTYLVSVCVVQDMWAIFVVMSLAATALPFGLAKMAESEYKNLGKAKSS